MCVRSLHFASGAEAYFVIDSVLDMFLASGLMKYKCWRSGSDPTIVVIVRCGRGHDVDYFDLLPPHIQHLGPWTGSREGDVADLRTRYRLALVTEGFCVVCRKVTAFEPEVAARRYVPGQPPVATAGEILEEPRG